ncbi:protein phosphatase 2C domain-containing protein [Nocardia blacklockiae]|uniref:protein phosphatase 2C domain-containing protein n=1 Tax=Nocardia blacklockiae TaxID=480036 RepID=UPI001894D955|nr:protein phosphatase 2C domain-containing protein [Nocardia blacklockiae]MBF6171595.1 protein phosphatase 2C domain-containing protein [Nocardia blacklockiae]
MVDPVSAPRCPGCDTRTAVAERWCEHCGRHPAVRRVALPDPTALASGCDRCGATEFDAEGYCTGCGAQHRPPDRAAADLGAVQLVTDRGIAHARNEDAVAAAVLDTATGPVIVVAVADGVSTSDDPQVAAGAAVRAGVHACSAALTADRTAPEALLDGLEAAFAAVRAVSVAEGHSPSCTYVSAVLRPDADGEAEIAVTNVGDSRAYWLRGDGRGTPSRRLTVDDSFAELLVAGGLDEQTAMRDPRAHALMRWLGADSELVPADIPVRVVRVRGPGVLLLCSDGMWNYLSDPDDLAATATAPEPARELVDFALRAGGADNITVALAPLPAADAT